jgi:hypothetical protein
MKRISLLLIAASLFATALAHADGTEARWYRYYDDNKQANVTDSITPLHVSHGYDELTAKMQLIKHVPAQRTLSPQEIAAGKAKQEADVQRGRNDKQLLRLYSSPADAEHERDRQIEAIQLRIDFSTNSLTNLRQRRAAEAQKAAVFERTGKPVPKDLKDSIADYDKQALSAQTEITTRKAEQEKIRTSFTPTVQRLKELLAPRTDTSVAVPQK